MTPAGNGRVCSLQANECTAQEHTAGTHSPTNGGGDDTRQPHVRFAPTHKHSPLTMSDRRDIPSPGYIPSADNNREDEDVGEERPEVNVFSLPTRNGALEGMAILSFMFLLRVVLFFTRAFAQAAENVLGLDVHDGFQPFLNQHHRDSDGDGNGGGPGPQASIRTPPAGGPGGSNEGYMR